MDGEDAARELPNLPLEDALQLVHLYAERESPKYEKAAMRWLERYLVDGSPRLRRAWRSLRVCRVASYVRFEERELVAAVWN